MKFYVSTSFLHSCSIHSLCQQQIAFPDTRIAYFVHKLAFLLPLPFSIPPPFRRVLSICQVTPVMSSHPFFYCTTSFTGSSCNLFIVCLCFLALILEIPYYKHSTLFDFGSHSLPLSHKGIVGCCKQQVNENGLEHRRSYQDLGV